MTKDTEKLIRDIKKRVDQRLDVFFKKEIKEAAKVDQTFKEATKMVAEFTLGGGKRVRAALMYYGYLASGQKKTSAILDASLSMELAHSFLLIHDDIIDNDELRRGKPTLHKQYQKLFWKLKVNEPERLSRSLAILCGDIAFTLANKILINSNFKDKLKIEAVKEFQSIMCHTEAGEIMDVLGETQTKMTPERVIKIYKLKTAKYTIEGPLLIGSILGGADEKLKETLRQYAIYLGVAFQIYDDMIDIFGNQEETGKEIGKDLREGKRTTLILKALDNSSGKAKQSIKRMLGNKNLTQKDLAEFKKIALKNGALDYCTGVANNLSVQAKETILKSDITGTARDFFLESANYIIERRQ